MQIFQYLSLFRNKFQFPIIVFDFRIVSKKLFETECLPGLFASLELPSDIQIYDHSTAGVTETVTNTYQRDCRD